MYSNILSFFVRVKSQESVTKSSRMIYSCDKIRFAAKIETKQTRHQTIRSSLLINPTLSKGLSFGSMYCWFYF